MRDEYLDCRVGNASADGVLWVNQNQTADHEIAGGYMWSPKRNQNVSYNQFYENMKSVDLADLVFSYYGTKIQHLGVVRHPDQRT